MPSKNLENIRRSRREWYERNREHAKAKVRERQKMLSQWLAEYKEGLSCEKCGEDHVACLDFHHRDPKEKEQTVPKMANGGWSISRIKKELAKCDVLCSNCHRKLHWKLAGREGIEPSS